MPELRMRRLGRTGLLVRELGFGGSNVALGPGGEEALVRAFALGVNFVETGRMYRGSEYMVGGALRQLTDRGASVHVASKTLGRSRDTALRDLERSLEHLGLPKVDIYQIADVRRHEWEQAMGPGGALEGLREAQEQGLVRHVGISSHSHQTLQRAIEGGEFDTVQLRYNVFNPRNEGLVRQAHRKGIGVIVMKPLGGFGMAGALKAFGYWDRVNAKTLLRYVLSNRHVSVVIPGMRSAPEVDENVDVALTYKPMTPSERTRLREDAEAYLAESAGPEPPPSRGREAPPH